MLRLMIRIILKVRTEEDNLMLLGKEKEFVTLPDSGIKRSFNDLMSHKEDIINDDSKMTLFMVHDTIQTSHCTEFKYPIYSSQQTINVKYQF